MDVAQRFAMHLLRHALEHLPAVLRSEHRGRVEYLQVQRQSQCRLVSCRHHLQEIDAIQFLVRHLDALPSVRSFCHRLSVQHQIESAEARNRCRSHRNCRNLDSLWLDLSQRDSHCQTLG